MKAVLFDLDGTLVNTLDDLAYAMNYALSFHGLPTHPVDDYRYFVGNGIHILTERACADRKDMKERVEKTYAAYYSAHWNVYSKPYPNIIETLKCLKEQKIKLCVFSNKPHADTVHVIQYFFGKEIFDAVQGQTEDMPIKPDPAGAKRLAKHLDVAEDQMLYVGDSGVDMQCAKRAGMHATGALWGFRDREELLSNGAEILLQQPLELLRYVAE